MSTHIIETRQVPVKEAFDLIVAGGGVAGIAAGLAGARRGLKTMLVEKSPLLGGLATLGLINWYEPLCDGTGRTMTTGIAEELLKLSVAYGYGNLPEQWTRQGEPKPEPRKRYASRFNPSIFALALNELLVKNGVELRYDMIASWPVMEGCRCTGLITESAGGREYFPAKVIVDATGDADIMARAGVPCRNGVNYLTYTAHGCTTESIKKVQDSNDMVYLNDNRFWVGSDLNGRGHPEGLHFFWGIPNEERSEYIRMGQALLLERIRDSRKDEMCPYALPGMAQLRKTRCIVGTETFIGEDGQRRENSIGAAGDFRIPGKHYEIPLGVLFNGGFPNLLAAGRIVSADGDGWEITRVIPTAALTGEAAGTAASLMIGEGKQAGELNAQEIQRALEKSGVKIHF
ncbi:MAG: FAD-dependent oxidoreductase [Treponema sp.]|jgi:hypothetical protein|nr:FAD-dependent oxidoreductase [Treponema sp.]